MKRYINNEKRSLFIRKFDQYSKKTWKDIGPIIFDLQSYHEGIKLLDAYADGRLRLPNKVRTVEDGERYCFTRKNIKEQIKKLEAQLLTLIEKKAGG